MINAVVAIALLASASAIATGVGAFLLARRIRGGNDVPAHEPNGGAHGGGSWRSGDYGSTSSAVAAMLRSRWVRLSLELCSFSASVLLDSRRTPGERVIGLKLVDARSGKQMSTRQAFVRVATSQLWQALTARMLPQPRRRPLIDDERLRAELATVRSEFADDEDALREELARVYREHRVGVTHVSCLPIYARLLLNIAIHLPIWSPLQQSLPDRLAGTVVVRDRTAGGSSTRARATRSVLRGHGCVARAAR